MDFLFTASMEKKNSEDKSICHPSSIPILPLSSRKAVKTSTIQFSPKNKGFINYVFCKNWAVRNPAGTRVDSSSLVNKQVVIDQLSHYLGVSSVVPYIPLVTLSEGMQCGPLKTTCHTIWRHALWSLIDQLSHYLEVCNGVAYRPLVTLSGVEQCGPLYTSFQNVARKLPESCQKVPRKLTESCQKLAKK